MVISDADRARFPGFSDEQIADIFRANETRAKMDAKRVVISAQDVFLAKILKFMGYRALLDFLRGGTSELAPDDFIKIVGAAEWLELKHDQRREAVIAGFSAEAQSRRTANARRKLARNLQKNNEIFKEEF